MKRIGFAVKWGVDRDNAWSGTPEGLYKALSQYYDVQDIDLTLSPAKSFLKSVIEKLASITCGGDFSIISTLFQEHILKKAIKERDSTDCFFAFNELNTKVTGQTYVYQDLTVNYLYEMKESGSPLLQYTPLRPKFSSKIVAKRKRMVDKFYQNCAGCFTMSKYLCDYMKRSGVISPDKVHYVGGGCNLKLDVIDHSNKQGNKFLFVGKDFERKNGPLVIEAFKKVHEINKNSQLYIVGPEALAGYREIPEGIVFLGRKTYSELVEIYNACDYFVMPSKFEAYGIVFAEALIYGLPCIGKKCYAMEEFIDSGRNGYLIEKDDPTELATVMIELMNRRDVVDYVMNHQKEYIETYSWDAVALRIKAVIDKSQAV